MILKYVCYTCYLWHLHNKPEKWMRLFPVTMKTPKLREFEKLPTDPQAVGTA